MPSDGYTQAMLRNIFKGLTVPTEVEMGCRGAEFSVHILDEVTKYENESSDPFSDDNVRFREPYLGHRQVMRGVDVPKELRRLFRFSRELEAEAGEFLQGVRLQAARARYSITKSKKKSPENTQVY